MGIFERCLMQNCMCFQGAISVNRRQLAGSLDFDFTISRSLSDFNCAFVSLIYSFFFFLFCLALAKELDSGNVLHRTVMVCTS